jgi:hypothetical protein
LGRFAGKDLFRPIAKVAIPMYIHSNATPKKEIEKKIKATGGDAGTAPSENAVDRIDPLSLKCPLLESRS